jgi:hypothetical protein
VFEKIHSPVTADFEEPYATLNKKEKRKKEPSGRKPEFIQPK